MMISFISIMVLYAVTRFVDSNIARFVITILSFYILYAPLVLYVGITKNERIFVIGFIYRRLHKEQVLSKISYTDFVLLMSNENESTYPYPDIKKE